MNYQVLVVVILVVISAAVLAISSAYRKRVLKPDQLVLLGFGAVQKAVVTLMFEREPWMLQLQSVLIIEPLDLQKSECYRRLVEIRRIKGLSQVEHLNVALTKDNYKDIFRECINNALVIDLAVRLGTKDLIKECSKYNSLYINTAIDIWPEQQSEPYQSIYDIKQKMVAESDQIKSTAILNFGANPGLISHLVKLSLEQLAVKSEKPEILVFAKNKQYSKIAQALNLTLIQISERDTQEMAVIPSNQATCKATLKERQLPGSSCQMVNTWSVMGFLDEAYDKCQISIGTHEDKLPPQYDRQYLERSGQIVFDKPGVFMKTTSFEPIGGKLVGFNIPHAECYSLVDFLRVGNAYRPSAHYSYFPCAGCRQITAYGHEIDRFTLNTYANDCVQKRVLRNDEIKSGYDSLGALMYFREPVGPGGAYRLKTLWSGSILDSKEARTKGPEVNATTIQVAISTLAAIKWMLMPGNQKKGLLEPEALPTQFIIDYCRPYLGSLLINYDCSDRYNPVSDQYLDLLVDP